MQQPISKIGTSLDGMAIAVSVACVIHCLTLPVVLVAFPILGSTVLAEEQFHSLLLILIIPSSVLAFYLGCRQHGDGSVLRLGISGLVMLCVAAVAGIDGLGIVGEKLMTAAGGVMLATAHVVNFRRCRALRCEEKAACAHAQTGA